MKCQLKKELPKRKKRKEKKHIGSEEKKEWEKKRKDKKIGNEKKKECGLYFWLWLFLIIDLRLRIRLVTGTNILSALGGILV